MCDKPAGYWKARYEALEARISDPAQVQAATALVDSAATIAARTEQPFRQVFESMLRLITRPPAHGHRPRRRVQ